MNVFFLLLILFQKYIKLNAMFFRSCGCINIVFIAANIPAFSNQQTHLPRLVGLVVCTLPFQKVMFLRKFGTVCFLLGECKVAFLFWKPWIILKIWAPGAGFLPHIWAYFPLIAT